MTYMAMEFMPTTTSGHDQPRQPRTSITQKNPANSANVQPELNTAHDGDQTRLTMGHTNSPSSQPAARHASAASASLAHLRPAVPGPRSISPAISPRIMVA